MSKCGDFYHEKLHTIFYKPLFLLALRFCRRCIVRRDSWFRICIYVGSLKGFSLWTTLLSVFEVSWFFPMFSSTVTVCCDSALPAVAQAAHWTIYSKTLERVMRPQKLMMRLFKGRTLLGILWIVLRAACAAAVSDESQQTVTVEENIGKNHEASKTDDIYHKLYIYIYIYIYIYHKLYIYIYIYI